MKRVKLSIVGTISILFLSACGGGGSNENNTTTSTTAIASCPMTTTVKKGDKVVALEENTEVKVVHKDDGTKTVCISKGKAEISK